MFLVFSCFFLSMKRSSINVVILFYLNFTEPTTKITTLLNLNYDVLEHTFAYLDILDIISLKQTNSYLHRYGDLYLSRCSFRRFHLSARSIECLLRKRQSSTVATKTPPPSSSTRRLTAIGSILRHFGAHITQLTVDLQSLDGHTDEIPRIFQLIREHCCSLNYFCLTGLPSIAATYDWSRLAPRLCGLRSLSLINSDTSPDSDSVLNDAILAEHFFRQCADTLETLQLKRITITGECLQPLLSLHTLELRECYHDEPYELQPLFDAISVYIRTNPRLEHLRLADCGQNTLAPLYASMQRCRSLTIRGGCIRQASDVAGLLTLPLLTRLKLDFYHSTQPLDAVTFTAAIHGLATVNALEELTIKLPYKSKFRLSADVLNAFGAFTRLRRFKFVSNRVDSGGSVDRLFERLNRCHALESVKLTAYRCSVESLMRHLPALTELYVKCHQLTDGRLVLGRHLRTFHLMEHFRPPSSAEADRLFQMLEEMTSSADSTSLQTLDLSVSSRMVFDGRCADALGRLKHLRMLQISGPALSVDCFNGLAKLSDLRSIACQLLSDVESSGEGASVPSTSLLDGLVKFCANATQLRVFVATKGGSEQLKADFDRHDVAKRVELHCQIVERNVISL